MTTSTLLSLIDQFEQQPTEETYLRLGHQCKVLFGFCLPRFTTLEVAVENLPIIEAFLAIHINSVGTEIHAL